MKTAFNIRLYQITELMIPVLQMIANHNSGKLLINLAVIEAHVKTLEAIGMANWSCAGDNDMLVIHENGMPALTITVIEFIGELTASEADLINQENLS